MHSSDRTIDTILVGNIVSMIGPAMVEMFSRRFEQGGDAARPSNGDHCQAQRSGARLGNRDIAPVATLQSRPQERQMYVTVLAPGGLPASLAHVIFICYYTGLE